MSFTSFLEEWQRKNIISPVRSFTKGQQQHLPGGLKCYLTQPDYEGISEVSFPPIIDIWSQLWLKILAKNACPKTTDVSQNNWSRGSKRHLLTTSAKCACISKFILTLHSYFLRVFFPGKKRNLFWAMIKGNEIPHRHKDTRTIQWSM